MTPTGAITLCSYAAVDATYSHSITFTSPSEQLAFWGSKAKARLTDYMYVRRERRYIQVERSFEELDGVNYMYFTSRADSKLYYCFIIDREYVNEGVTKLYFEVDVLQSFMFDYKWQPSYIAQAHVDRWHADNTPKYSYTDEGLDYGSEYMTEAAYKITPDTEHRHGFYLVYCKQHSELVASGQASEPTKVIDTPIPYDIYLVPEIYNGNVDLKEADELAYKVLVTYNQDDGSEVGAQIANMRGLQRFMSRSAFGNYVVQIVYVPYCPFSYKIGVSEVTGLPVFNFPKVNYGIEELEALIGVTTLAATEGVEGAAAANQIPLLRIRAINSSVAARLLASMDRFNGIEGAMPSAAMWKAIKAAPYTTERDRRYESKLLTYPYRFNLFTDWKSAPLLIKNEFICEDKIKVHERIGFGFNMPRRYFIENYRKDIEGRECSLTQTIPLEQPIINDQYYTYMLENKNQIAANVSNAAINLAATGVTSVINMAGTAAAAAAGAPVSGGSVIGSVMNVVQGALDMQAMIRSENAKQKDIRALPDTITSSNDATLSIADKNTFLTFYRKAIACDYAERLAQYWHMFGYIVKAVELPNTRSRLRYNYIKTIGANLEGNIEAAYLNQLKAIYDKGVTLWHYSATNFKPLDYTYENIERSLL